jgi:hypothetical protein
MYRSIFSGHRHQLEVSDLHRAIISVIINWCTSETVTHAVANLFKARKVEPEIQPLLGNGSEITFVSRQRPRKTTERRPLLGNRSVNTFVLQRICVEKERCFLRGLPTPRSSSLYTVAIPTMLSRTPNRL